MLTFVCANCVEVVRIIADIMFLLTVKRPTGIAEICGDRESAQTASRQLSESWLIQLPTVGHSRGQNAAHQKSKPQKSSWTFSGIFQWTFSGYFHQNVTLQWNVNSPVDFCWTCPRDFGLHFPMESHFRDFWSAIFCPDTRVRILPPPSGRLPMRRSCPTFDRKMRTFRPSSVSAAISQSP